MRGYDFDAAAAKQMLADAGFPNGFDTKIFYRDVFRGYLPEPGSVAVEFQTQLRDNLGINAEVVVMESGEFIDESTNGRLDGLYLLGWGADYPHVTNFLDFHFGKSNPQYGTPHEADLEPARAGFSDRYGCGCSRHLRAGEQRHQGTGPDGPDRSRRFGVCDAG